jgi:hypothetical protein
VAVLPGTSVRPRASTRTLSEKREKGERERKERGKIERKKRSRRRKNKEKLVI